MKIVKFKLSRLRAMSRPAKYIDELWGIRIPNSSTEEVWSFDIDSDIYKALEKKYTSSNRVTNTPSLLDNWWKIKGPEQWEKIHGKSIQGFDVDWLKKEIGLIPCGDCRRHARLYIKDYPPDYDKPETHFVWSVCFHNHVNKRLGRSEMSLEDAARRWGIKNECEYNCKQSQTEDD